MNLFKCSGNRLKLKKYILSPQKINNTTTTMTWDCTNIPNFSKLSIDNFSVTSGAFSAYSSFNGRGNSDLKSSSSCGITNAWYDSANGTFHVTANASTGGAMNDSYMTITPAVFSLE